MIVVKPNVTAILGSVLVADPNLKPGLHYVIRVHNVEKDWSTGTNNNICHLMDGAYQCSDSRGSPFQKKEEKNIFQAQEPHCVKPLHSSQDNKPQTERSRISFYLISFGLFGLKTIHRPKSCPIVVPKYFLIYVSNKK